ncbi:Dimethyladenosine transferase [Richelia intracellularis HM01]|uniref:16S rRNA (adenine(1518)-N(6)/adenine(1519)-N(6))- dimethyltransferase RsmA n=1 Tax=Richelia intracellularis TaxID=1164990 RepID=UPI0002B57625|nr:16S rRNA (adenine(1518)-N(6)/adenine(1519)-N(6))-dimethyltransferase RsmA [Richelia intracellularis]CCH64944.1 Dimethyladenosine transferase [Richelia intracellularis HM01]
MVKPRKYLAQHWLKSENALNNLIKAACCELDQDIILEIGPGTGILTRRLLPLVKFLVGVELDKGLCKLLVNKLGKKENFLLLQGDFLSLDISSMLVNLSVCQQPNKVVANIPYNITGPIIEKLLGRISQPNKQPYELIILLIQKEVAQRLVAEPGSRNCGALTVKVQYLAECKMIASVPAEAFYPKPKVDSAIVSLCPRKICKPANNPKQLEALVKLGFRTKRKMLRNNLQSVIERDHLIKLLEDLQINPQARAEDLSLHQWIKLSNKIC